MAVKKSKMKRKSSNGKMAVSSKSSAMKKSAPAKLPSIKEPMSKSNMIKTIADITCLNKKEVDAVFECLGQMIEKHVTGPGQFTMPGLMKINVIKKKARPARKGVNPFTGEEITIKAKPAYKAVKIKALKKLKEMVA